MKKILIVEDNKLVRRALKEALYCEDFEILEVEDCRQTLEKIKEYHPDLLTLDIKMPYVDGIEILKEIRAIDRELPIIIITGYKGLEKDPEIALGNISSFMTKPINIDVLRAKVTEILG